MSILNNTVNVEAGEPIKQLYIGFEERGCRISAAMLRTAFIQRRVFEEPEFRLTAELKYFIEKETLALEAYLSTTIQDEKDNIEEKISKEFSKVTPFLLAKLAKLNVLEERFSSISSYAMLENKLFNLDPFSAVAKTALLKLYKGYVNPENYFRLLNYSEENISLLKGMKDSIERKESIEEFENEINSTFDDVKKTSISKSMCFEPLRQSLIVLAAYYWNEGNIISTQMYLAKAIHIMDEKEPLYNALLFLQKELKL